MKLNVKIYIILMVILLIPLAMSKQTLERDDVSITYTSNSKETCSADGCITEFTSGGARYIYEDYKWKPIEEARSLKGKYHPVIEQDNDYPIEIIDFNYTSVKLYLKVSNKYANQDIDLKVYNKFNKSIKPTTKYGTIRNKDKQIKLLNSNVKHREIINLADTKDNILNMEFKWGLHSTNWSFQPDSVNGTDNYLVENSVGGNNGAQTYLVAHNSTGAGDSNHGIMNWSFVCPTVGTEFLINQVILEVQNTQPSFTTGDTLIYPMNQSWTEGAGAATAGYSNWNYPFNGGKDWDGALSAINKSWNLFVSISPAPAGTGKYNITLNDTYFTRLCDDTLGDFQDKGIFLIHADGGEFMVYSSDYATAASRPKLYIITIPAPAPVVSEVSLYQPTDGQGVQNYTRYISFNYTPSSYDGTIANCSLFTNESGTYTIRGRDSSPVNYTLNNISSTIGVTDAEGMFIWNVQCCNDANTCWSDSSNFTLYVDFSNPQIVNLTRNVTNPEVSTYIRMNATIEDSTPTYSIFSWNLTGLFVNESVTVVPTDRVASTVKYVNESLPSHYICYKYWGNDTAGHTSESSPDCFYIKPVIYNSSAGVGTGSYAGTPTLNITYWYSNNGSRVIENVDTNIFFETWHPGTTQVYNYSFALINRMNYTLSMFPNATKIYGDAMIEYNYAGHNFNYFIDDYLFSSAIKDQKLYISTGTTIVTFTVIDESGTNVEGAFIKIQQYDVGTNTYQEVEVLETNAQGEAIGNVILNTVWYRFVIEYNGIVYLTEGPLKMTASTRTFQINLLTDFFNRYSIVRGITIINCTYSNYHPYNFKFEWDDTNNEIEYGCLKVVNRTMVTDITLKDSCIFGSSGTVLVSIGNPANHSGVFVGTCYVKFPDNEVFVIGTHTEEFGNTGYEVYGRNGVFYGLLIIITLFMVGCYNPSVAIILSLVGLVLTKLLGLFQISYGWMVGLIIIGGIAIYKTTK